MGDNQNTSKPIIDFIRRASIASTALLVTGCSALGGGQLPEHPATTPAVHHDLRKTTTQLGTITDDKIVDGRRTNHNELTAYIYAGQGDYHAMDADACKTMAHDLSHQKKVTRWIIAFANPTSKGTLKSPALTDACAKAIHDVADGSHLSLAVAGGLDNWQAAAENPARFAASAQQEMRQMSETVGYPVTGLDIDWEFPTASQTKLYTKFVAGLRTALPQANLSMTVGCNIGARNVKTKDNPNFPGDFQASLQPELVRDIDMIQLMAYARFPDDSHNRPNPNLHTAHALAPAAWTADCVRHWSNQIGGQNNKKLLVGHPAYGMEYDGAYDWGDNFRTRHAVWLKDYPDTVIRQYKPGFYEVAGSASKVSIVPRSALQASQQALRSEFPGLGGAMVWPARGMDSGVVKALGS